VVRHLTPREQALLRSLVLLHRYSIDITAIARESLGWPAVDNRSIQLLLAIHRSSGQHPSQLAERMGASRSSVSRSISLLADLGLISRNRATEDGRSITLRITPKGRRRVERFAARLSDYFRDGAPLVKESLHELQVPTPHGRRSVPISALDAASRMSLVGAEYVEDVVTALEPYGVRRSVDRWALALAYERGTVRPSELANELDLTFSATSGLIDRLEERTLAVRRYSQVAGDRRAVVVRLTSTGEAAARELLRVFDRHVDRAVQTLAVTLE
jgi:DNA-binding MarR family transcriptional regulator